MRTVKRLITAAIATTILSVPLLSGSTSSAQDGTRLEKSIHIQAQAMGTSTQLGRSFGVNIIIEEFSTADDQKALIEAFNAKRNEGLVNALHKMKSKGRIGITGTLGYDVAYVRRFQMPDGSTVIRLVTDRPIRFGEVWADSRSREYNLSALEIVLHDNKKENSGTLLPAAQFKLDKDNHLQIELRRNPFKLVNIQQR